MRISDEADNIPKMTIQSWIECLSGLTLGYELRNIWKMDELGLFSELYWKKSLLKNGEDVAANGSKFSEPIVIWKSKSPRCFKNLQDKARPSMVHYFSIEKSSNFLIAAT